MTIQLTKTESDLVKKILHTHLPNTEFRIFGSRANGTARRYSDLDIILLTDQAISLQLFSALREAFAESNLPFKVDLVDWQNIDGEFQAHIKNEWKNLP